MGSTLRTVSVLVLLGTVLYQAVLRDVLFGMMGVGRAVQPVSDFPYKCRKITEDENIQACEDMWLDEKSRTLFLACSEVAPRRDWMPNIHRLNESGRALTDHVVALSIDNPTSTGGFSYRVLKTPGFAGVAGDGRIHVLGITGATSADGSEITLSLINTRPSVDPTTGELLDNTVVGGNSTIEVFSTGPSADEMKHVKTYAHAQITTPNNVALTGNGGFYFTNDHGPHKVGLKHHLSPMLATGDVSHCSADGVCKMVSGGLKFPNGLVLASDQLLYVPSAAGAGITVFAPQPDGSATKVHHVKVDYPVDNISEDANGDLWLAAMPKLMPAMASFEDPVNAPTPPATVFKMSRSQANKENGVYEYVLEKVIEDRDGEVLPGVTTVVHDASTGRLFLTSIVSRYVTVCEKA